MRINLTVIEGPHEGREFAFKDHDHFIVGRNKYARFQLPFKDKYFSRIHFLIEINPPYCRLIDMGSTNGTSVNGQSVSTVDLNDGDLIKAGKTVIRVSFLHEGTTSEIETLMPVPPEVPGVPRAPEVATEPYPPRSEVETLMPAPPEVPEVPQAPEVVAEPPRPRSEPSADRTINPRSLILSNTEEAVCLGCEAPMSGADVLGSGEGTPRTSVSLCPACRERIEAQFQPIDGYQLVRELGRGGMGVVHLALRADDGARVALKTIRPACAGSNNQIERFLREAKILEQLDHPHIVAFRAMGESNGLLYFTMDYVPGTDVSQLQKGLGGPLPIGRAVDLTCQMLDGLAYAHARGFVHRDIKPGNLLVERRGGRDMVRLTDFGLARTYQASQLSGLTLGGEMAGTMAFMAPEQITQFREVKPPVDQYAAAATLYKLLTNHPIYNLPRQPAQQILMVLQEAPIPILTRRPDLPGDLAAIIHRALSREPSDRFPDAAALREALRPYRHKTPG
jgi:serine/threonine-protein kinase